MLKLIIAIIQGLCKAAGRAEPSALHTSSCNLLLRCSLAVSVSTDRINRELCANVQYMHGKAHGHCCDGHCQLFCM